MKKRIISLVLALTFVFASVLTTNAASFSQGATLGTITTKTPVAISYKDISRLAEIATNVRGKQARIVNATKYNGSNTTWIVRLNFGDDGNQCAGDFVVNVYPYSWDLATQRVAALPFEGEADKGGTAKFGPCWYYFGLFDDVSHQICGFAVAERINRWPNWDDQRFDSAIANQGTQFPGTTFRGVRYTGAYPEISSLSFVEDHIK